MQFSRTRDRFRRLPRLLLILAASVAAATHAADAPAVRSVQDALKKQGFYFGKGTGEFDEETRAAVRRFQTRRGLAISGEIDAATLQAIDAGTSEAPATAAAPAPEKSASVRERAQSVVQQDREFLARVETLGEEVAVATVPVTPAVKPERAVKPAPRTRAVKPLPRKPEIRQKKKTRQPEPVGEEIGSSETVSEAEIRDFVHSYIAAAEGPSPAREVAYYASQVDYFDSGKVSRKFVANDQERYYRRWPSRDFKILGEPKIERASESAATVRFRIAYSLKGKAQTASGEAENVMRLRRDGPELKIVGIHERKLR